MIDPWTALSAAAATVGFIDLGITVVEKTNEIKRSTTGAVKEVESLDRMTAQFREEAIALANAPSTESFQMTHDEERLKQITLECRNYQIDIFGRSELFKWVDRLALGRLWLPPSSPRVRRLNWPRIGKN